MVLFFVGEGGDEVAAGFFAVHGDRSYPFAYVIGVPHGYVIFASPEAPPHLEAVPSRPDQPEHVDWPLSPGTAYTYRVTAVDRNGLEMASAPARVRES